MRRKRREIENCEIVVEEFLKKHPRLQSSDGWFVTWCRIGNGGDPPYHKGPFKEDQLYVSTTELLSAYPQAGLDAMMLPDVNTDDLFFPVIYGALLAFNADDENDPGWVYYEGKWERMGQIRAESIVVEDDDIRINENPIQTLAALEEIEEVDDLSPDPDYMEMYFYVGTCDGETTATLTPAKHFKEEGCVGDSGYQLEYNAVMKGLEDQFEELTDATYGFEGTVEEARKLLLAAGLKQDDAFDAFMKNYDS